MSSQYSVEEIFKLIAFLDFQLKVRVLVFSKYF